LAHGAYGLLGDGSLAVHEQSGVLDQLLDILLLGGLEQDLERLPVHYNCYLLSTRHDLNHSNMVNGLSCLIQSASDKGAWYPGCVQLSQDKLTDDTKLVYIQYK